jgi:DNA-binding transcriptional regulator YiaG
MKKANYKSTSESRKEAVKVLAALQGKADWPKGTQTHWVLAHSEIKRIRHDVLKLSQSGFAKLLKKELITVQSWEQGRRTPDSTTAIVIFLLGKKKVLRNWMEQVAPKQVAGHAA